jgi:hypothetical protein
MPETSMYASKPPQYILEHRVLRMQHVLLEAEVGDVLINL